MPLPIIFPGDELTLAYQPGYVDGPADKDVVVIDVLSGGDLDVQMADDPNGDIWTAMKVEEEAGLFRIVDVRPARQRALTEEDVR